MIEERQPLGIAVWDRRSVDSYIGMRRMGRLYLRSFARDIAATLGPAGSALEVGPGAGWALAEVARQCPHCRLTGVDISLAMLDRARSSVTRAGVADQVSLVEASAYQMPFADDSFDLVYCTDFLHAIDDLPRFLGEVARVLKPGGRFVASAYTRDTLTLIRALAWLHTACLRLLRSPLDGMRHVIRASYTPEEVRDVAATLGLIAQTKTTIRIFLRIDAQKVRKTGGRPVEQAHPAGGHQVQASKRGASAAADAPHVRPTDGDRGPCRGSSAALAANLALARCEG
jgi:ubiquinone/menaquinone biosynthesis C-methylase UbiE